MGTWGTGSFENDTAADFGALVAESADLAPLRKALDAVGAAGTGDLDAPLAEEALAAAEVVARLQGRFGVRSAYSEAVDAWCGRVGLKPDPDLVALTLRALDRIVAPPSELLELWAESDDAAAWKAGVADLRGRVAGPGT